jgi:hypothetical protein
MVSSPVAPLASQPTAAPTPPPRRGGPWPFLLALLTLVAMLCGSLLYVFHTLSRAPGAVLEQGRAALAGLERVAAAFHAGTVTTAFARYATEIEGVSRLQVATLRQVEVFERTEEATLFWGTVDLPELVVSARAPVEYTYYLDLDAEWDFVHENLTIRVLAPPIRFNRPAVDVSAIRYEVVRGSLLRDERGALERLARGMTVLAHLRARENLPLVRETARQASERFVANWLAWQFEDGAAQRVEVRFRDEPGLESLSAPAGADPSAAPDPGSS